MIVQSVWQKSFGFLGKPVVVQPSEAELTSDAGLLPIREFDQRIGLTEQFAAALTDLRYQPSVTLDIDPFDDPTHGQQQLTFFHGYYQQYQYLPRVITCAENDMVVMLCLLFGTAHAALGAGDDLEYLVGRLRDAFPGVWIVLRADSGFGVPAMYAACERLEIDFTIGIGMNATLKGRSDALLQHVVEQFEATGELQREFCAFWYRAGSWPAARWVVIKCEANAQGTNRRAVVTNRPGAFVLPGAAYDAYTDRGESENRNKELKCGLQADRVGSTTTVACSVTLWARANPALGKRG